MEMTTHIHLVLWLGMHGALPPLPKFIHGVMLKPQGQLCCLLFAFNISVFSLTEDLKGLMFLSS
jgi:hypothetical protein